MNDKIDLQNSTISVFVKPTKEVTLRDFIGLLYIPKGFKRSNAALHLYTTNGDFICKTRANSIGVNPYLERRVVSFENHFDIVSNCYYIITLDIGEPAEEESSNGDT